MKPYILGHRGAPKLAIENSILAFKKAVEIGVDGVELDIHLTSDNQVVVIHDETIDRLTEGQGYIKDYKFEDLIKYYLKDNFFDSVKIPSLNEVLLELKNCKLINIEIKNSGINYPNIENRVIEIIQNLHLEEKVVLSSFNHYSIKKIQKIAPQIKSGILYMANLFEPWEYAKKLNVKTIHPYYSLVDKKLINNCHENDFEVFVFGANTKEQIQNLIDLNVDGIITDYPKKAMKLREN
ncbi:MAG: glycerophosphodiester phosphodiesterase [Bacillota bacterium]